MSLQASSGVREKHFIQTHLKFYNLTKKMFQGCPWEIPRVYDMK